jgi:hypothetical protein
VAKLMEGEREKLLHMDSILHNKMDILVDLAVILLIYLFYRQQIQLFSI